MGFMNAMKGAMNPFGSSRLNPMNAPGMGKVAGLMGRAPGMQKLGGIPGMQKMSQVTPGMKGMFPQKGLGPSAPPMQQPMPTQEMMPAEGGGEPPQMPPQVQPQPQQRSRFAQQMMPRNKQQFMRGLNPFNMMR